MTDEQWREMAGKYVWGWPRARAQEQAAHFEGAMLACDQFLAMLRSGSHGLDRVARSSRLPRVLQARDQVLDRLQLEDSAELPDASVDPETSLASLPLRHQSLWRPARIALTEPFLVPILWVTLAPDDGSGANLSPVVCSVKARRCRFTAALSTTACGGGGIRTLVT